MSVHLLATATCSCGWCGDPQWDKWDAENQARIHLDASEDRMSHRIAIEKAEQFVPPLYIPDKQLGES